MLKSHFGVDEQGHLLIGGISAVDLAERFGTPLYVMDEGRIRDNYQRFYRAWSECWDDILVSFAYKANSNKAVCKALWDEGCGAEVSSLCELGIALEVGVPGSQIIFNGNYKTVAELELAIKNDALINIDNLHELQIVGEIASRLDTVARMGFRVNPEVEAPTHPHLATGLRESKFGLDVGSGRAIEAYRKASKMEDVEVESMHSHIGSQILDPQPFVEQAERMMSLMALIREETGVELKIIDMGGGIGIPYEPDEEELPPKDVAEKVVSVIERAVDAENLPKPKLVFEPGRSIVADAGVLLGRVGYVKEREGSPDWIAMDAGMNALIRPALYGAYHHIEVANKMKAKHTEIVNVAGPLCESGDYLGKERSLPETEPGDLLVVFDTGAYGIVMSSQHTCQPRPAMVMVGPGGVGVIREREHCEDLTRLDKIPEWLE